MFICGYVPVCRGVEQPLSLRFRKALNWGEGLQIEGSPANPNIKTGAGPVAMILVLHICNFVSTLRASVPRSPVD